MKVLLVNPNTSQAVTDRIMVTARSVASADTELLGVTATSGAAYIATRAEAVIGARAALELLAEHYSGYDAAVIAAFGDPGLGGARELLPIPVVGLAGAALHTACMLGQRFAIVSFASALGPWYRECVEFHGLEGRLAAVRLLDSAFRDITTVQEEKEDLIVELCCATAKEDGADVAILAGAPLAGLAARVARRVPIPLVDCVAAAVRQAEALAALRPIIRRAPVKPVIDVPAALAKLFRAR
jgi:allantoin racemase